MAAMVPGPLRLGAGFGPSPTVLAATAATVAAALAGPLAVAVGPMALPGFVALPVFLAIAFRPELGAYLYLAMAPLIVGIGRDTVVPFVRPNEALLLLILAALATRALADRVRGHAPRRTGVSRVDGALLLLAVTGSILPLLFRYGRGLPISVDDALFALVMWKVVLIYGLFRYAVTEPSQVAVCLGLAMLSAVAVAILAGLQVLELFGVPELLLAYYDQPFEGFSGLVTERGTSTIASSFGMADLMVMNLAIALAWLANAPTRWKPVLVAGAGVFVLGCIMSGQVSGLIGMIVALLAVGATTGRPGRILAILIPMALAGSIIFWPVIAERLSGFGGAAGLPPSWVGRLDNLQRFIWPELSSGVNWLVGVRPAARVPAPEPWRDWVYIESGYAWLLWTGGLPMVVAFAHFVQAAFRELARVVRGEGRTAEPAKLAATASIAGLATIVALMLFDPHLTMRGAADLFFPLLALSFVGPPARPTAPDRIDLTDHRARVAQHA